MFGWSRSTRVTLIILSEWCNNLVLELIRPAARYLSPFPPRYAIDGNTTIFAIRNTIFVYCSINRATQLGECSRERFVYMHNILFILCGWKLCRMFSTLHVAISLQSPPSPPRLLVHAFVRSLWFQFSSTSTDTSYPTLVKNYDYYMCILMSSFWHVILRSWSWTLAHSTLIFVAFGCAFFGSHGNGDKMRIRLDSFGFWHGYRCQCVGTIKCTVLRWACAQFAALKWCAET